MSYTNADQNILGYLGRALSFEFSAVQQYRTQKRLLVLWGLPEAAQRLRQEACEENQHIDKIITRMLALGVAPNASQLSPVRLGSNLHELLLQNYKFETEIVELYHSATRYCASVGDHDNRLFFETLLAEENINLSSYAKWILEIEAHVTMVSSDRATF